MFAQLALTLIILFVCCFAPGFFFVRRLHWSAMEKLSGSVGLSFILVPCPTALICLAINFYRAPKSPA